MILGGAPVYETARRRLVGRVPFLLHLATAIATIVLVATDVLPVLFTGDVNRYHAIASGSTFWREQPVEFPPGSAAMVWVVGRWGENSIVVLFLTNLVLDLATFVVLRRQWGDRVGNRYLLLTAPLLPLSLFRLDHLSGLLAALALGALRAGRSARAGTILGVGTLTKLWPAALLVCLPRRLRAGWVAGVATIVVGLVGWMAAFGADAPTQVVGFRGAAGWHVESVPGSVLRTFTPGPVTLEGGAWRVGAPPAWTAVAFLGVGLVILLRCWQLDDLQRRHVAVTAALLVVAPLFSLQYVLWLVVPVAVLTPSPFARRATLLTASAVLLTTALAADYLDLLVGTTPAILLLNTRNVIVVGLLAIALMPSQRQSSPPRLDRLAQV